MLAYAARRPLADRRPHPNTMLVIIGAHVAVIAAVMSAKMDIQRHLPDPPTILIPLRDPTPPPPHLVTTSPTRQPTITAPRNPKPLVPTKPLEQPQIELGPPVLNPGALGGGATGVIPEIRQTVVASAKSGPQLITPESELKPPYPASKLLTEEEAVLRLKLTIDEQGRVVAVDPVGRADPAFLEAARRHLIAHWRYKPAIDDGRAVAATMFITLRFELDG